MLTPLLVTVVAAWRGGERVSWWNWASVLGGLLGALLIVRPGAAGRPDPVLPLPLGPLCSNALFQELTSRLTRTDSPATIFLHTSAVCGVALRLLP
ncbi:hypothetical protein [Derxia gummosa]|uniref:Uncharacterized protein n=1 Tax=Derxia gummosa DSM 723 TaxID=1121388 RepID=A0A8B6X478_9BURK|nr:hypothetical protein [Derxia gummosa]